MRHVPVLTCPRQGAYIQLKHRSRGPIDMLPFATVIADCR